jgi:hypothetical protein
MWLPNGTPPALHFSIILDVEVYSHMMRGVLFDVSRTQGAASILRSRYCRASLGKPKKKSMTTVQFFSDRFAPASTNALTKLRGPT